MIRVATVLLLFAFVASSAMAVVLPPESLARAGGSCAFVDGKVIWCLGRTMEHFTGTDADGKIFYGAFDDAAGTSIYNPTTNTWRSSKWNDPTSPLGYDYDEDLKCEQEGGQWSKIGLWTISNQAVAYNNKLYVAFGHGSTGIRKYDPAANGGRGSWTNRVIAVPGSNAWEAFRRGAVGIRGSKIYMTSGASTGAAGRMGCYDIATDTFTEPITSGAPDSQKCAGVVVGNYFVIAGGMAGATQGTNIYVCDLTATTPTFTTYAGALPAGVRFGQLVAYNGKAYLLGGLRFSDNVDSNGITEINPATGAATVLTATLPFARHAFGAAVNPATGEIYVGGGGTGTDEYVPTLPAEPEGRRWWKCDLDNLSAGWTALASDPAYFPYEDWNPGADISGTVRDGSGNPIPFAVVGIKPTANAMADAVLIDGSSGQGQYVTADANGNWGPIALPVGETRYFSAWKNGFAPTADPPLVVPAGVSTVPLVINKIVGKNIVLNTTAYLASNDNGGYNPASRAFDGILGDSWETTWGSPPEYLLVDLDSAGGTNKAINGSTIWWASESGSATAYSVDTMTDLHNPSVPCNPLDPAAWTTPNPLGWTVTTQYSTPQSQIGYSFAQFTRVDPIRLPEGTVARGVRIRLSEPGWPPLYRVRELQIHSATEYDGVVMGKVKDSSGNPIYNAAVQIDGFGGPSMITGADGFYSLVVTPGSHEVYGDAPEYSANLQNVSVPGDGTPLVQDIVLTAQAESVYNAGFETPGADATQSDGWEIYVWSGAPTSNYVGSRSTAHNSTPAGGACGWIHTGTPFDPMIEDPWHTMVYWFDGWLRPNNAHRVPVDPSRKYNFYFKMMDGDTNHQSYSSGQLRWLTADGSEIDGPFVPDAETYPQKGAWTQALGGSFPDLAFAVHPMLQMTPPAEAAYAEVRVGLRVAWSAVDHDRVDEMFFDDVVVDSVALPNDISSLKDRVDGAHVSITGKIVTTEAGQGAVPVDVFYVEEPDRASGIRVASTTYVLVNDVVNVTGNMATTPSGERYISAIDPVPWTSGPTIIKPLGANTKALADTMMEGLLVRVAGKVKTLGSDYYTMTDGGIEIKVMTLGSPGVSVDEMVTVTGVASRDATGRTILTVP